MISRKKNEIFVFSAAVAQLFTWGVGLYGIRSNDKQMIWAAIGLQCLVFLLAEFKRSHR